jgi:predicted  nucleic acid-binding Zn-ribbon protein
LQEQVEQEVNSVENSLETALKQLWEKAYTAANTINALREEKTVLQLRVDELGTAVAQLQSDLARKNTELEQLRGDLDRLLLASSSNGLLDKEEKLRLQERVKMILEKINAHL